MDVEPDKIMRNRVAPLAGARIEIDYIDYCSHCGGVAPLAGARIEI